MAGATKPLLWLAGPTASGKSALAMELAQRFSGEIISADAVAVYRGMDIGSAKPTWAERRVIAHHLIDVVDPDQPLTVATYARLAHEAIRSVWERGHLPILVGGSGLYLRSVVRGYAFRAAPQPTQREHLRQALADPAVAERLWRQVQERAPLLAGRIHPHDHVRIIRALERLSETGDADHAPGATAYQSLGLGLTWPKATLHERIAQRTQDLLANGWLQEVETLLARFPSRPRALEAVGYKECVAHLSGQLPFEQLAPRIVQSTRQFAKRQLTWFRREPDLVWIEGGPEGLTQATARVTDYLERTRRP